MEGLRTQIDRAKLEALCRENRTRRPAFFASVLHDASKKSIVRSARECDAAA